MGPVVRSRTAPYVNTPLQDFAVRAEKNALRQLKVALSSQDFFTVTKVDYRVVMVSIKNYMVLIIPVLAFCGDESTTTRKTLAV